MVKVLLAMLSFVIFSNVASAAKSDFETERMRLICAMSSMASYSKDGELAWKFLEGHGWKIDKLTSSSENINVKLHVMTKKDADGNFIKVFFITGTEDLKDVSIDLKVSQVPFDDDEKILVHKGFRDYADAALSGGSLDFLLKYMRNHPSERFYLTGHSLGGAIATLIAARLSDAGADMSKIQVITFGAPSVGNREFVEAYQNKINLTRITMKSDPINSSLGIFGYVPFGENIVYEEVESHRKSFHSMLLYLDRAIRNYYDAGGLKQTPEVADKNKIAAAVYVAPIKIVKGNFSVENERYVSAILRDGVESAFTAAKFEKPSVVELKKAADFSYDVTPYLDAAKKSGCEFIFVQFLQVKPIRDSRPTAWNILLEETVCDLKGFPLAMNISGSKTNEWTILEAVLFAQEKLREERGNVFSK